MEPSSHSPLSVAALFGELVELDTTACAQRLRELDASAPALARELRALLEVDADAGDFFGLQTNATGAWVASAPVPVDAERDEIVGRYQLVREIGRGGMGSVWLARDARLDRDVALKFLRVPTDETASPSAHRRREIRARFLTEARAAASVDHPNVASVYDVGGTREDRLYIAMAYCEGGSLSQRLALGRLTDTAAVRIAAGIASGLAAAHRRGIVHRDIKPANVLFDAAENPRLADFGIALLPGMGATQSGMIIGTLMYLAPEQLRGERPDYRADLWAFGVMLYEMLTGNRPFTGDSPASLMHAVLHANPEPLSRSLVEAMPDLETLVGELLSKDPARRPESAATVADRLTAILGGPSGEVARVPTVPFSDAPMAPVHLTPLVGREAALNELLRALSGTRLLTLTGAGGSGKTRLASEAARRIAESGTVERAIWVDFTPVEDASMVPTQIAAALRAPEAGDGSRLESVARVIGVTRTLLVLDNCEHIVAPVAELAAWLLPRCPALHILATSRESLGVAGESTWLVPALDDAGAVALFEQRARAVNPSFTLTNDTAGVVRSICHRLDGIPLAIELAAARVRMLTPEQIAVRLDDAFLLLTGGNRTALPRHRTLRATMDWSYALLSPRERALLRRLAVFNGGFTLEAAEAVCPDRDSARSGDTARLDITDVLDSLSSLVEKSMVMLEHNTEAHRYRLLETVRQYAYEQLAANGERELFRAAHAEYFVRFAETFEPQLLNHEMSPELMSRLTLEDDNLRAANSWSTSGAAAEFNRASIALRFAGASFWYWHGSAGWIGTSRYGELRAFVKAALERGEHESPMLYARAVLSAGLLCLVSGSWADAESTLREARRLFEHLGAVELETVAEVKLGATLLMMGRLDEAWSAVTSAAELAQPLAPSIVHGLIVSWRGVIARARGDLPLARECQEDNVTLANSLGIRIGLGHAHAFLGAINVELGLFDAAVENFRIAATVHLDLRDAFGIALDLEGLSGVALGRGDHHTAAVLLGAADAWRTKTGVALPTFDAHDRSRRVSSAQAALGTAYNDAYRHGRTLSPADAEALILGVGAASGAAGVSDVGVR